MEDKEFILKLIQFDLDKLVQNIEVKWDRYTEIEVGKDTRYTIFGWLPSEKHEADILVVTFTFHQNETFDSYFNTTSVKYSKQLSKNWDCGGHTECKKWKVIK